MGCGVSDIALGDVLKQSPGEAMLALHLRAAGIHAIPEFQFHPARKFRADFALPESMLLIEVDGGNRMAVIGKNGKAVAVGRHTQDADLEKLNEAAILGWRVMRFSPAMVKSGKALQTIERFLLKK